MDLFVSRKKAAVVLTMQNQRATIRSRGSISTINPSNL